MNSTAAVLSSPVFWRTVPAFLSANAPARPAVQDSPLGGEQPRKGHAYWNGCCVKSHCLPSSSGQATIVSLMDSIQRSEPEINILIRRCPRLPTQLLGSSDL